MKDFRSARQWKTMEDNGRQWKTVEDSGLLNETLSVLLENDSAQKCFKRLFNHCLLNGRNFLGLLVKIYL